MTDNVSVAKIVNIEELFKFNDQALPPIASSQFDDSMYQESVEAIYNTVYAPALDKFLETRWYTTWGLEALRSDFKVLAEFVAFFRAASLRPEEPSPPNLLAKETRLIWNLLNMCDPVDTTPQHLSTSNMKTAVSTSGGFDISTDPAKTSGNDAASTNNGTKHEDIDLNAEQAKNTQFLTASGFDFTNTSLPFEDSTASVPSARLTALTSLLTNSPPSQSTVHPLIPRSKPHDPGTYPSLNPLTHQLKAREDQFWSYVGRYVSAGAHDNATERKTAVKRARGLLDDFENRDVVYTIMRIRWLQSLARDQNEEPGSGRAASVATTEKQKQNEAEVEAEVEADVNRERELQLCLNILKDEAGLADGGDGVTSGIGTNDVAMRVAGMAVRAFGSSWDD